MRSSPLTLLVCLAALACTAGSARPFDLPDAIERIRPSVVQVAVQWRGSDDRPIGPPWMTQLGTGFLVHESGVFATAEHVVAAAYQHAPRDAVRTRILVAFAIQAFEQRGISMTQSFTFLEVAPVARDATADVALLRSMQPFTMTDNIVRSSHTGENRILHHRVATLDARPLVDGERVATSGYPLEEPVLITTSGFIAGSPVELLNVPVGNPAWPFLAKRVVLADMQVNFGNSGGPIYRVADGSVVGLSSQFKNTWLLSQDRKPVSADGKPIPLNSGLSVIAPVDYILSAAKEHGIDLEEVKRR